MGWGAETKRTLELRPEGYIESRGKEKRKSHSGYGNDMCQSPRRKRALSRNRQEAIVAGGWGQGSVLELRPSLSWCSGVPRWP